MIDFDRSVRWERFEVRVGHARVVVESRNRDDAILQARRLLSQDMPRLYDVIMGLQEHQFSVATLQPAQS